MTTFCIAFYESYLSTVYVIPATSVSSSVSDVPDSRPRGRRRSRPQIRHLCQERDQILSFTFTFMVKRSVADLDQDPYVFWPTGSASGSANHKYGSGSGSSSGSFHHQAKIERKTLLLFCDFLTFYL